MTVRFIGKVHTHVCTYILYSAKKKQDKTRIKMYSSVYCIGRHDGEQLKLMYNQKRLSIKAEEIMLIYTCMVYHFH